MNFDRTGLSPRTRVGKPFAVVLSLGTALSACAPPPPQQPAVAVQKVNDYVATLPPELKPLYSQVPLQGQRNAALNHMRAGLAALDVGALDTAAASFDEVLKTIETVYAENPQAEKARSVWYEEAVKDFKGEPYERVMAYYYRGLIYMMQGDYQNARASFRGGLLQATFMEENQRTTGTFATVAFLEGWAGRCAKLDPSTVDSSFQEAKERNANLSQPPTVNNLLVLFETGSAPVKKPAGDHNQLLQYAPGELPPVASMTVNYGAQQDAATQSDDLFYQASTRGGRKVDAINQGKVVYQDTTRAAGQAATAAGAGLATAGAFSGNRNLGYAGLGLMMVGLIADAAANSMQTQADTRQWDNLPGNLMLTTFAWPPTPPRPGARAATTAREEPTSVTVNFDRAGTPVDRTLDIHAAGACALAWGRELPATRVPPVAPGSVMAQK